MHDVNIEETKLEISVLALSLFYDQVNSTPLIKASPDQSDKLGFEIKDVWKSAKEEIPHSTDHITVDRH